MAVYSTRQHAGTEGAGILRRAVQDSEFMMRMAARVPSIADVQRLIQQGAVDMTVSAFLTIMVGFSIGLGLAAMLISRSLVLSLVAAAIGAWLPYLWLKLRRNRRSCLREPVSCQRGST